MTELDTPEAASTREGVEQLNLRMPAELKTYLERLAGDEDTKLPRYCIAVLEAHVESERAKLAEIFRKDAARAERYAADLERKAAKAERKNENRLAAAASVDDHTS